MMRHVNGSTEPKAIASGLVTEWKAKRASDILRPDAEFSEAPLR